jgi:hypothetical protein
VPTTALTTDPLPHEDATSALWSRHDGQWRDVQPPRRSALRMVFGILLIIAGAWSLQVGAVMMLVAVVESAATRHASMGLGTAAMAAGVGGLLLWGGIRQVSQKQR